MAREPEYLSEQVSTMLLKQLAEYDQEIDTRVSRINAHVGQIADLSNKVNELYNQRYNLADELERKVHPDFHIPRGGVMMEAKTRKRYWRPHPFLILPNQLVKDEDDI